MTIKQYDPDLVDLIVDGVAVSGFQEDSILEVEFDEDFYEIVAGVDGDVSRSRKVARVATLTIHLMNTSQSNALLTGLTAPSFTSGNGTADVFVLLIRDRNGVSTIECSECWVQKMPSISHSGKANNRDWQIKMVKPIIVETGVA